MKQILTTLMLVIAVVLPVFAADTHDDMYMDMAVVTAKKAVRNGNKPTGAVIILNGVWRAEGTAKGDKTAELVAFENSRLADLHNATVYTVNEPTTATYNALVEAGVQGIVYANPREAVVSAGIYPSSAYDDSKAVAGGVKPVQFVYPDAEALLKK